MTERQMLELLLQKVTNIETEQQAMKADQQSMKMELQAIKTDQQSMKADISGLKDGQLRIETHIETEIIDKVRALFDAREVQNDVNQRLISVLDRIEAKIDVLQMETAHIRRIK